MSDEFTKAVCEAVQELHSKFEYGDYYCEICRGKSPQGQTKVNKILHKEGCIVTLAWEYLNPAGKPAVKDLTCGFNEAWVGSCENTLPCYKHINLLCSTRGCFEIASHSCEHTFSLVCGAPHCDEHSCTHAR